MSKQRAAMYGTEASTTLVRTWRSDLVVPATQLEKSSKSHLLRTRLRGLWRTVHLSNRSPLHPKYCPMTYLPSLVSERRSTFATFLQFLYMRFFQLRTNAFLIIQVSI